MATSGVTGVGASLLEEAIPRARPRATAYFLGVFLVVIMGAATAIILVIPTKNLVLTTSNYKPPYVITHAGVWLGAIGLASGLIGLISLVFGNNRRLRLVYEFTASAAELAAALARASAEPKNRRDFKENSDYVAYRKQEDHRWSQSIDQLRAYEKGLLTLGAYEHALRVSRWIAQYGGRLPQDLGD